ncbi:MFS transporter [Candidatus Parcubacteria bacterium]|nr:MAG: MFS transporter [Candidatus Parcubacteria bacterium]
MNKTIKLLMISDIFVLTGFGLIDPILAIFINDNITGGSIFTAGIASSIFLITKSFVQLPFSRHVDSHDDDDDLKWLLLGTLMVTSVPFFYIFAKNIVVVYLAQLLQGIGSGLAYPAWLGLWSTHLDKKKESYEWSLYSTSVGLGTAVSASVGAAVAQYAGFKLTFLIVAAMSFFGCTILIYLKRNESPKKISAAFKQ